MQVANIEAEKAVLGTILINNDLLVDIRLKLEPDHFSYAEHQLIYSAICDLDDQKKPVDFVILSERDAIDTLALMEISESSCSTANALAYADSVVKFHKKRSLITASNEIKEIAVNEEPDVAVEKSISLIDQISQKEEDTFKTGAQAVKGLLEIMDRRLNGEKGVPTGFKTIDQRINGFRGGDLVIIAGTSGMGKTTYGLNIIEDIAIVQKKPVMIFSMEMPNEQLMEKMIASRGSINVDWLRTSYALKDESCTSSLMAATKVVKDAPIFMDDRGGVTVNYIRAQAMRVKRKHGLGAILIDYIQLMEGKGENRTVQIGSISRGLKALAKELDIPILALSQINRGVASREDKRPRISDLRESGAIEQDADIIQMLYRDEYYNKEMSQHQGLAEVITGKFRMGEPGTDFLGFNGRHSKFFDIDYIPKPPEEKKQKGGGFNL